MADGLGDPLGCSDTSQQPLERKMTLRTVSRRKTFFLQLSKLQNQEDFFFFFNAKIMSLPKGKEKQESQGDGGGNCAGCFLGSSGLAPPLSKDS